MNNHVILEGFMGSGKTTIGIRLSYKMCISVIDTDKAIEKEQKCTIREIFDTKGEEAFRLMETECLRKMSEERGRRIITLGGGTPVCSENREVLKGLGKVIYLKAKPETIYERLRGDTTRPLLQCADPLLKIRELMGAREDAYMEAADYVLNVEDYTPESLVDKIAELCK